MTAPPWNDRVMRCVVNHLIPEMKPYAGHTTDKLVLIVAARHAHPGGCGITVTRETLAKWLRCEGRTVSVSLARLRSNGLMVIDGREPHGGYRHRIVLCQRCRLDTAAAPCQRCRLDTAAAPCQRCPTPPADTVSAKPSAVSSRHTNREVQVVPTGTPVNPGNRQPPGTNHRWAGGRSAPPGTPLGSEADASESACKPSNQAREATGGTLLPFPARSSGGGTRVGAIRTGSRYPPGASTGNPFSNPGGASRPAAAGGTA
jgi:hypothetical protein